jgi:hypothetical protein
LQLPLPLEAGTFIPEKLLKGKEKSWGCLKETGLCYNPMNANQAKVIIWFFS